MKKLIECREYFKDLLTDCLCDDALEKSIFDSTEKVRYETFCETLKFVYGQEFELIKPIWVQETLNEFYSQKNMKNGDNDMYITKMLERYGSFEMIAHSIDELCNEMDKNGYTLVVYVFLPDDRNIMLTFKKNN